MTQKFEIGTDVILVPEPEHRPEWANIRGEIVDYTKDRECPYHIKVHKDYVKQAGHKVIRVYERTILGPDVIPEETVYSAVNEINAMLLGVSNIELDTMYDAMMEELGLDETAPKVFRDQVHTYATLAVKIIARKVTERESC